MMQPNSRFIFFGTPEFAATVLADLIQAGWIPELVVCNPDRPVGRKKMLTPPPAKIIAERHRIPIVQPERLAEIESRITAMQPDFFIVAAYGKIIPKRIIEMPRLGALGVHPSLLTRHRGASPMQATLLAGDSMTGTTLFLIDDKVDHGPIIAAEQYQIPPETDYTQLSKALAKLSARLLVHTLPQWTRGELKGSTQDEGQATLTKKFSTEDGLVDIAHDQPLLIYRKIKALNPEPGVYAFMELHGVIKRVKLLEAQQQANKIIITSIQPAGKKPRSANIELAV